MWLFLPVKTAGSQLSIEQFVYCWAGILKLAAPEKFYMNGIYIENGTMRFDIPEMLRSLGLPDTEENRDMAVEVAQKVATEAGLITPETNVRHTHRHRCAACRTDWEHDGKKSQCLRPKYSQCQNCRN